MATQRFFISPSRQCFTLRMMVRAIQIIDSTALVQVSISVNLPPTPRRRKVNISSRPCNRLAPGVRVVSLQLGNKPFRRVEALGGVGIAENKPPRRSTLWPSPLRQMPFDVPPFVQSTPLYNCFFTEDLDHAVGQGLGRVDNDEHPCLHGQASSDEVSQQRRHDGLVLGLTQPQSDWDLGPSLVMTRTARSHAMSSARAASVACF